ncbi:MAG: hypothetical protein IT580_13065, partial [Verrucomicrobiales bacterium]|nr:hypothetical protein [Verrucomicrobiales bacterium]
MSDARAIDRASAFVFLSRFPAVIRKRGQAYYGSGAVKRLDEEIPGECWTAEVQGGERYEVTLLFDPERQTWDAECDCLTEGLCKHACAALLTLITQNATPATRATAATPAKVPASPPTSSLSDEVLAALGRALTPAEKDILALIRRMYRSHGIRGEAVIPDLQALGWIPDWVDFGSLRLSTSRLTSELGFWHHLAALAAAEGFPVPPFLQSIPVPPEILEQAEKTHRTRAIEHWRRELARMPEPSVPQAPDAGVELRLRLEPLEVILENRTGEGPWRRLRPSYSQPNSVSPISGASPEAQMIWSVFAQGMLVHYGHCLSYRQPEVVAALGRLLATQVFRPYLVQADGSPLVFHEEPLRWSVREPENVLGDYHLTLLRQDGSPAPPTLFVAPTQPPLHVTAGGVFPGPPPNPITQLKRELAVPAPIIESKPGLQWLRLIRAPLPERLAARVR